MAKPDPILTVDGMRRSFGGLVAVDVEHLEIQRGVVTALIGPNGAGKTTLFNLLCGFDVPDAGDWVFRPNPPQADAASPGGFSVEGNAVRRAGSPIALTGLSAYRIARAGMVRTFQLTRSFSRLSVMDNMLLAAPDQRGEKLRHAPWRAWRATDRRNRERAEEILDHFVLAHVGDQYAGALSGGQRKLLEMTRAVMAQPELLLLDEPLAGVNPVLIELIMEHVGEFPGQGMTVLYVEHNMDVLKTLFGLVPLRQGSLRLRGTDIAGLSPHDRVAAGMGYVPQLQNVFAELTVEENLRVGAYLEPKAFVERYEQVTEIFPLLGERRRQRAGLMSGGERQLVAMGRALMGDPVVLLLDEPSAGLSPANQAAAFERVQEIHRSGTAIVMVEQNARRCLQICDRGYVLDHGQNAYTGTGQALLADPKVVELYLGTSFRR